MVFGSLFMLLSFVHKFASCVNTWQPFHMLNERPFEGIKHGIIQKQLEPTRPPNVFDKNIFFGSFYSGLMTVLPIQPVVPKFYEHKNGPETTRLILKQQTLLATTREAQEQ